jgi:hypothetical protein
VRDRKIAGFRITDLAAQKVIDCGIPLVDLIRCLEHPDRVVNTHVSGNQKYVLTGKCDAIVSGDGEAVITVHDTRKGIPTLAQIAMRNEMFAALDERAIEQELAKPERFIPRHEKVEHRFGPLTIIKMEEA